MNLPWVWRPCWYRIFLKFIKKINEEGTTIFLVEQNARQSPRNCRIALMFLRWAKSLKRAKVRNCWMIRKVQEAYLGINKPAKFVKKSKGSIILIDWLFGNLIIFMLFLPCSLYQ